MAYVPGTEIEKPTAGFPNRAHPLTKIRLVKRALRRAAVPEEIVQAFNLAAVQGNAFANVDTAVAQYVEVSE